MARSRYLSLGLCGFVEENFALIIEGAGAGQTIIDGRILFWSSTSEAGARRA